MAGFWRSDKSAPLELGPYDIEFIDEQSEEGRAIVITLSGDHSPNHSLIMGDEAAIQMAHEILEHYNVTA